MYKVYRKYKKNGFRNTLNMTKMCSLRGTVEGEEEEEEEEDEGGGGLMAK